MHLSIEIEMFGSISPNNLVGQISLHYSSFELPRSLLSSDKFSPVLRNRWNHTCIVRGLLAFHVNTDLFGCAPYAYTLCTQSNVCRHAQRMKMRQRDNQFPSNLLKSYRNAWVEHKRKLSVCMCEQVQVHRSHQWSVSYSCHSCTPIRMHTWMYGVRAFYCSIDGE